MRQLETDNDADAWCSASEALAMLKTVLNQRSAAMRICECAHAGLIRARADAYQVSGHLIENRDIPPGFWWADGHEALSQDWVAGDFSTWIERKVELKAFGVRFLRSDVLKIFPKGMQQFNSDPEVAALAQKLDALVPSAALSLSQAAADLQDPGRVSFRGPALELREALREVLDHLAPDSAVMSAAGYQQEKDRLGPTMRQKARFILSKGRKSEAAEKAVTAFEEAVAGLTRAVYEITSAATHAAKERQTVMQLRRYVVVVLHEILSD